MTTSRNKDENRYILAKLRGEVFTKIQFTAGGVRSKFTTRNRRYESIII